MTDTPQKSKKPSPAKKIVKLFIWLVVIAAVLYIGSESLKQYQDEEAESGIVICEENGDCTLSLHVHADIAFDLCGESPTLEREAGPLEGLHTHKEKNYLHVHNTYPFDNEIKEKEFHEDFTIQNVIDVFELSPEKFCGTNNVEYIVEVNGEVHPDGLNYDWNDEDDVVLRYRVIEE